MEPGGGMVVAVARDFQHRFSKQVVDEITVLPGLGVEADAHAGVTVQHRSRVAADPTRPNLRQVHLIHAELLDELSSSGYDVTPGQLGENITTRGVDLLALPRDTLLFLGPEVVLRVTGLRNPCKQINAFRPGLLKEVLGHDDAGRLIRKAGIMSVVVSGGRVRPGDPIAVEHPAQQHRALEPV